MRGICMSMNRTELSILIKAAGQIAWAGVFLFLDFNITDGGFTVKLLPEWTGWLLYSYAVINLAYIVSEAALLKPLTQILFGLELARWIISFTGISLENSTLYVFETVIAIYVHFQLFSNAETAARKYHLPCADSILIIRTILVILTTVIHLINLFSRMHMEMTWLNIVLIGMDLTAALGIVIIMFEFVSQLKKVQADTVQ